MLLLTALGVTSCNQEESNPYKATISEVKDIKVHSELVTSYFENEKYDHTGLPYEANGRNEIGDNQPINITWESNYEGEQEYHLVFKDDDNQVLNYYVKGNSFEFKNYKLETHYDLEIEIEGKKSGSTSFDTPKGYVRTITIDGVANFRDLGALEGIKQGLLYRSMTFENNTVKDKKNPTKITEEGKKEVLNLGIKSEIDLRKTDERGVDHGVIEGVNYQFMPLYYGGRNILTYKSDEYNNPENVKKIFEFLAVKENYPVDFHCVRGTDRTGCIAFVTGALLGVDEISLKRDFMFSNYYYIGSMVKLDSIEYTINPQSVERYLNVLKLEEGDTLQEKTFNYLKNKIGVSEVNLNNIISILKDA